jgi:hypothetical protein
LNAQNAIEAMNGRPPLNTTVAQAAAILRADALARAGAQANLGAITGTASASANLSRAVSGFEYAFCDNLMSFGMRIPMSQLHGDGELSGTDFGDLSFVFKGVLWECKSSGALLSGGVVVTAPTGPGLDTIDGTIRDVLLQPYYGYILPVCSKLYLQGFGGFVVPTDSRDVTFGFTDIGCYYALYRSCNSGACLTGISPAIECHLITPFNHRGSQTDPVGLADTVNMTYALHIDFWNRMNVFGAIVHPVTGPKPFDFECQFAVNYAFGGDLPLLPFGGR